MDGASPNVFKVRNPLKKALFGPKISREEALARAASHLENLRTEYVADLVKKTHLIEQLAGPGPQMPDEAVNELGVLAPVIFNLAGTFGYTLLQEIAASLYDALVLTASLSLNCRALVIVHARAAKLAAPGMPEIPTEEAAQLLSELRGATLAICGQEKSCGGECAACPT